MFKFNFYVPTLLLPLLLLCLVAFVFAAKKEEEAKIKVFTVATEHTDGYLRYKRSARVYDIEITTLGLNKAWRGGDMSGAGGGYKLNLLRKAIKPLRKENNTLILFTDSYDVLFTATLSEIFKRFNATGAKVLFSAERYCWPREELAEKYPPVEQNESRFLNSGIFMGYAPQMNELLAEPIDDKADDQLYFTQIFLNATQRAHLGLQLDTKSLLFQNLNGAKDDVQLHVDLDSNRGILENLHFKSHPAVLHGNGYSKIELNSFANYLAETFNGHCTFCAEQRIELNEHDLPVISLALIVAQPVPFFDICLKGIETLNYPKQKLHLFIYSAALLHDEAVQTFAKRYASAYASVKLALSTDALSERRGRQLALHQAKQRQSDYIFFVDADAHIEDVEVLRELLIINKQFIAPIFSKYNELWSNFWGALSNRGYYARSHDYIDIVKRNLIGMWNMPYVSSIYLIRKSAFKHINYDASDYGQDSYDPDMALCASLRKAGVFMYATNQRYHGHLINRDDFDATTLIRPDFGTLFTNKVDWVKKYIHPEYAAQLKDDAIIKQPCPDVYWFPIVTEAFCDDLVAIAEHYGIWSDGSNNDKRLESGYEAVPTRDIHMKQVGLNDYWLKFLDMFVRPLQERVFIGYYHNPVRSLMNFMVRYRPDEQPSLRPHHDASTYTVNLAMNHAGIDYQGGGCHFLRYNCSVTSTEKGWMLMHPGRLTHFHEGLLVTNGTRYIMISFIDP